MNYCYVIIYRIIIPPHSTEDVEDLVSDVFEAIFKKYDDLDKDKGSIKSYIGSVSRNKALNFIKNKENQNLELNDTIVIKRDSTEEEVIKELLKDKVREEVSKMPEPEREILIRYYFYYQKIKQISEEMNIVENTVKTKLYRSRDKLKESLSGWVENDLEKRGDQS